MVVGTAGDTSGNSLACRIHHTAWSVATGHCGHGNRFGGSVATDFACLDSLVDPYCFLAQTYCSGPNELFGDLAECISTAQSYGVTGNLGDYTGDTIQCRLYHLELAAGDPAVHCPHASPGGAGVCI